MRRCRQSLHDGAFCCEKHKIGNDIDDPLVSYGSGMGADEARDLEIHLSNGKSEMVTGVRDFDVLKIGKIEMVTMVVRDSIFFGFD